MCCCLLCVFSFFFFKQKTAYEMRISDWSSDVCSSDLTHFLSGVGIFTWQQARRHLDYGNVTAETRETLCQLATNRAAAEHHQPLRQIAQIPQRITGEDGHLIESGNARQDRKSTRLNSSH